MSLFIHVGTGKTGTSSIQHWLSYNYSLRESSQTSYIALRGNVGLIEGSAIVQHAKTSPHKYCVSNIADWLRASRKEERLLIQFISRLNAGGDLIISDEALWSDPKSLVDFLSLIPNSVNIELVVMYRPLLGYIKSAWWQWWKWKDVSQDFNSFSRLLFKGYANFSDYHMYMHRQVSSLSDSIKISPLLMGEDAVKTLASQLRISPPDLPQKRSNKSIGEKIISIYEKYPEYRKESDGWLDNILVDIIPDKTISPWPFAKAGAHDIIDKGSETIDYIDSILSTNGYPRGVYSKLCYDEVDKVSEHRKTVPIMTEQEEEWLSQLILEKFKESPCIIEGHQNMVRTFKSKRLKEVLSMVHNTSNKY